MKFIIRSYLALGSQLYLFRSRRKGEDIHLTKAEVDRINNFIKISLFSAFLLCILAVVV